MHIVITILIWALVQISEVNALSIFDNENMSGLLENGLNVSESGKYSIWAWARGGSSFQIKIGEHLLNTEKFGVYLPFSWGKIGEVELEADKTYDVQLDVVNPDDEKPIIEKLAVMPANFNPQKAFELMRVYPDAPLSLPDQRMRELRHTDSPFDFPEYGTKEEWEARRHEIRRKLLVSAGLFPMLERNPLNPKVVETLDRDGYIIEKLYIETFPGVYFPGCLYRPKDKAGPLPVVINPHGHWQDGRMAEAVQRRCANFALQGYLAFSYNMIGYIDNDQMEHRIKNDRMYLWSVSIAGLQLWNSMRALDFVTSLPEADPEMIACTGCSGGGSQTFMITATDDRVRFAAPVNMVSFFFQGGCICENAPGARYDAYNVEIAACAAPRPQILIGATGDWTDLLPEAEYPDVLSIYRLYDAEDKLTYYYQDAGHNYNQNGREAVYKWFGKWILNEDDPEKLREVETPVESIETLRVFDDKHTRPDDALDQDGIIEYVISQAKKTLEDAFPKDAESLDKFRDTMGTALADVLNVKIPDKVHAKVMPFRSVGRTKRDKFTATRYVLNRSGAGDQTPAVLYKPKGGAKKKTVNLIIHSDGKAAMVDLATGNPDNMLETIMDKDHMAFAIDVFMVGEHPSPFADVKRERQSTHFTTFSAPDEAIKVQDIITAIAYLKNRDDVAQINLIGLGEGGLWCLLANALIKDINKIAVDLVQFDNRDDASWIKHLNIPGILRVGGLDTAIACAAPRPLFIYNTGGVFDISGIKELYVNLGASDNITIKDQPVSEQGVVDWIIE
jgi:dienelactone hydrolase